MSKANQIIKLIVVLAFSSAGLTAQTYFSEYRGMGSISVELKHIVIDSASAKENVAGTFMMTSAIASKGLPYEALYRVFSNGSFIYVRSYFIENGIPVSSGFEGFVDFENRLFFDFSDSTYHDYSGADSIHASLQKFGTYSVTIVRRHPPDTAFLVFDSELPKSLCGKYMFRGQSDGLLSARTGRERIELVGYHPARFNFSKKLRKARKICKRKGAPVNLLFPA